MSRRPNSSRPGCWTCKKRHRKCDESRPSCQKCAFYGEECEGFGAQRLAFRDETNRRGGGKHRLARPTNPPHGVEVMSLTKIDKKHRAVLKEFIDLVSQELALADSHNIWRDDIAPMISNGSEPQHLLYAILAVTLMHRTYREHRMTHDAAIYYDLAVKDLRVALNTVDTEQPRQHDSVLATQFLLTWFEILARDWEKWNVHLAGLTNLVSTLGPDQSFNSRFQQRLISAVARLDVPNTIWKLTPPLLNRQWYDLLQFPGQFYNEDDLDDAAVLAFHRLHVPMAQFAEVYANWLRGSVPPSQVREQMSEIVDRLDDWHSNLPVGLQWSGSDEMVAGRPLRQRSTLQGTILIHYLSMKLFALHVFNCNCALPNDPTYSFCRQVALHICSLIDGLGPPEKRSFARFRGDVGVILPLSVVSMFLHGDAERAWICRWVRRANHEGIWCGGRRSLIIEAWGRYDRESVSGRPVHTMVAEDNIYWKPGQGLSVRIMTYDLAENLTSAVQIYVNDEESISQG